MKYSEFREYLILNSIPLTEDEERLIADNQYEISKIEERSIIFLISLDNSPRDFQLLKKVVELGETPLSEREEEKRCYLKHKFINKYKTLEYINLSITEEVTLDNRREDPHYKTKFTKAEIEEFKEKFDTDLKDFELIEVED